MNFFNSGVEMHSSVSLFRSRLYVVRLRLYVVRLRLYVVRLCIWQMATLIKDHTCDEVDEAFGIMHDPSQEATDRVRIEYPWLLSS